MNRADVFVILITTICLTFSYDLQCPDASHWALRARVTCGNITEYTCLYDDNNKHYVETCTKPDIEGPGYKLVWRRNLDRAVCKKNRYQPFIFYTTETSDCILKKSTCNGEGQLVYDNGKTSEDVQCRCDSTTGYAFVYKPNDLCLCVPTTEDCSCYKKTCREPLTFSSVNEGHTKNQSKQEDSCSITYHVIDVDGGEKDSPVNSSSLTAYIMVAKAKDKYLRTITALVLLSIMIGATVVLVTEANTGICAKVIRKLVRKENICTTSRFTLSHNHETIRNKQINAENIAELDGHLSQGKPDTEITKTDVKLELHTDFVRTDILTDSLHVLRKHGFGVLIGVKGSGKSRNAQEMMKIYKKEKTKYSLLNLKSLHDWNRFVPVGAKSNSTV